MSTLVVAWVVFPLVLLAVTLGCGLAPEAVAGRPVPLALLPPVGLAVAVLLMSFATMTDATAEFAVPLVVALATGGFGAGYAGLHRRSSRGRLAPRPLRTPPIPRRSSRPAKRRSPAS